ncbi:Uncharacterised protein [Helicobacter cholecystus]|uniref:hypothetical protein n=1 Tax=Helicobacter cholecystus TaxID=45498 RepID=UPI000CF13CEB|nr:hypothetical protein [Helicobacter cholecystus]VEJ24740.1 Uncharacterised protein [Helicobacter cholecystus]
MKKIILSIFLLFTLAYTDSLTPTISSDSEVGKWRSFFGVEGGVGVFGVSPAFFVSANPIFNVKDSPFGVGYSIGILGGWQKYTYEKVGVRNTLGFAFSYVPDLGAIKTGRNCSFCTNKQPTNFKGISGESYSFYYGFDGLFDFVKSDDNHRFGMNLGIGVRITGTSGEHGLYGFLASYAIRTGFYTKINNSIFDLTFSISLLGAGIGDVIYDSPIMFGYKHLF